ncbi:ABC-type metal ion transport system periplasmic component/surface adhesin [Vibrio maritimus]|uniref:ABC-type metal ion transport system periplasmic component/surface adhesin n=1 Tax=Vibrio maritimus TaxID=990268 RepID=A0A090SD56_9VIBR|nr:ABC-type metal ion transport system periplasmic component/surface adhesin [Vibrio maritimus]
MFKHLILIASVVGFSANASNSSVDILTSLPATQMIVGQLVKDTELSAQNIAPARYGFERLPNWYDSQGSEKIEAVSKHAKVVVSMTSIWEEDPLFVHARAHNISIINVDAGQALTPNGLSVATLNSNKGISPFVWLSTANLMRMTEIIGDDLKRIWPEHDVKLSENQGNLLTELKQLNASQQKQLFEANVDSVIILDKASKTSLVRMTSTY